MKLVIAEKPMLARDIARAMCGVHVTDQTPLPISGNGYTVCACLGHLLELLPPDIVREEWGKPWTEAVLPISIKPWPVRPQKGKEHALSDIERLLKQATSVIHAGDPDDEGQLIVDEVLDYLEYTGHVERVLISDSIEKNIKRAFDNLKDNQKCRASGRAAFARSVADFCFGINESRLASVRCKTFLPVGRVQTPTLALVYERDKAIENHTKRPFYMLSVDAKMTTFGEMVRLSFNPKGQICEDGKHVFDRAVLERIAEEVQNTEVFIKSTHTREEKFPPLPYDLITLIATMNRRFGMKAEVVQDATQTLRDKYHAITYNRSDSRHLPDACFEDAQNVLTKAMNNINKSFDLDFTKKTRCFSDKKVSAHHAIIPQEIDVEVEQMTEAERHVYEAIVERYALQFMAPAQYDVNTCSFAIDAGTFKRTVKTLKSAGWKGASLADVKDAHEHDQDEQDGAQENSADVIPPEGTYKAQILSENISEGETKPLKSYTDGTLIKDMSSIAKYVKDEYMRHVLIEKDRGKQGESGGIGTAATRTAIITSLKERGFIEEDKKGKLHITSSGKQLIEILPSEIKSIDTTAKWWLKQKEVEEKGEDPYCIMEMVVDEFKARKDSVYKDIVLTSSKHTEVGICPFCGSAVVDRGPKAKKFSCVSNRFEKQEDGTWKRTEGCGFDLWKTIAGKKLTQAQVTKLLKDGKTGVIGGFKAKSGKEFRAALTLDGSDIRFVFENTSSKDKKPYTQTKKGVAMT